MNIDKNKNNSDKNEENIEDDDEWDELDDSLYEEEEEDDDSDDDYEVTNNRNRRANKDNKRSHSDSDDSCIDRDDCNNTSLDSGTSGLSESSRNTKRKKSDNNPLLSKIILESLSKNTNDQLKDYLRSYGLIVGGNKAALILRLEEYHQKRNPIDESNIDINESINLSISEEEMNAQMLLVVDEIKCDIDVIPVVEVEEPTTPQVESPKQTGSSLLSRINAKRKALGDITNNINDDASKETFSIDNEVNKINKVNNVKKASLFSQKISMAAKSTINIIEDKVNKETDASIVNESSVIKQPSNFRRLIDPNRKKNGLGGSVSKVAFNIFCHLNILIFQIFAFF
jgi:hypothetical protein